MGLSLKIGRRMDDPNSAIENRIRPDELLEKYQIKKDAYYARLNHLGIKPYRDSSKRVYLTDEQVTLLDELHLHINQTGKMEGFNSSNNGLVKAEENNIDRPTQKIEVNQPHPDQFAALLRSSAEYAAGMEIAKYTIAAKFQENPDLLPDDLKTQVEEAKKQVAPKSQNAGAIAQQFLNQYGLA